VSVDKTQDRYWRCERKVAYDTRKAAKRILQFIRKRQSGSERQMKAYRCRYCGMFHLGHKPKRHG